MNRICVLSFIAMASLSGTVIPLGAHAQDSLANVSKASVDSAVAIGEMTEAGVKVVAGAVALPFVAVGVVTESTGTAVRRGGQTVWDNANGPLVISPETVTAQRAPQVPYDREDRRRGDQQDEDRR